MTAAARRGPGFTKPSKANEPAFNGAVDQVTQIARGLLGFSRDERSATRPRRRSLENPGQGGGPLSLLRHETRQLTPLRFTPFRPRCETRITP
jgi:hypothetical protein